VHVDADLAKILATVELDCEIPVEALVAVAEILAYVYRSNGKLPAILKEAAARP
jgi:flagellar biosynthesis protein